MFYFISKEYDPDNNDFRDNSSVYGYIIWFKEILTGIEKDDGL